MFPKNRGIPKWMVKIMVQNPIKMDDLGGFPIIFGRERGAMGGGVVKVRILYDFIGCG